MRREKDENRAKKLSLLARIADHRKQRHDGQIIGLTDSEEEEEESDDEKWECMEETLGDVERKPLKAPTGRRLFKMRDIVEDTAVCTDKETKSSDIKLNISISTDLEHNKAQDMQKVPLGDVQSDSIIAQLSGLTLQGGNGNCNTVVNDQNIVASDDIIPAGHPTDQQRESSDQAGALSSRGQGTASIRDTRRISDVDNTSNDYNDTKAVSRSESRVETILYQHQKAGVEWLLRLYKLPSGGILADDMGLGKTMQVSFFLSGILRDGSGRRALVVAPKTLVSAWKKELGVCGMGEVTFEFGGSAASRQHAVDCVMKRPGVLLTTYGMVQHNTDAIRRHTSHDPDDGPLWDVVVMDEGHKLKNPKTQLREKIEKIPARMRLLVTGTPIQNDLMEMHSLFNLVCPGILGSAKDFKSEYAKPITQGSDKYASLGDRERAGMIAELLRKTVAPYMLRREKQQVFKGRDSPVKVVNIKESDAPSQDPRMLSKKKDFVVWLRLMDTQMKLYNAFLQSDSVRCVLNHSASPLASLTVLKKICDHPALLSERAQESILAGLEGEFENIEDVKSETEWKIKAGTVKALDAFRQSTQWNSVLYEMHSSSLEASCKTAFVLGLLKQLTANKHRTLVFSQSRIMLDILEAALKSMSYEYCRIDGSISSAQERQCRVDRFQENDGIPVFLLSSQVGGLGLTLTAADRVIIVDPAWNPSVDSQSVDRAYRIGQTKDVVVYRLISCGSVEDKIYRKQVFKGGLFKTGMEDGQQFRYFSLAELKDIFSLDPSEAEHSSTQKHLHKLHAHQRIISQEVKKELELLQTLPHFVGLSDHDLLYSEKKALPSSIVARASVLSERKTSYSPSRKPKSKSSSAQNWSGDHELSSIFEKALSLNGNSVQTSKRAEDEHQKNIQILENSIQKQKRLLQNQSLVKSLQDNGEKIRTHIVELETKLKIEQESTGSKQKALMPPINTEVGSVCRSQGSMHGNALGKLNTSVSTQREDIKQKKRELYNAALKYENLLVSHETDSHLVDANRKEVEALYSQYQQIRNSTILK